MNEGSGLHIDYPTATVVLCGDDVVDVLLNPFPGKISREKNEAIARAIVKAKAPDYVFNDADDWYLGATPETIDYLLSRLDMSGMESVRFTVK